MVVVSLCSVISFVVKEKTAYELRISDWSSDVCSSVLTGRGRAVESGAGRGAADTLEAGFHLVDIAAQRFDRLFGGVLAGDEIEGGAERFGGNGGFHGAGNFRVEEGGFSNLRRGGAGVGGGRSAWPGEPFWGGGEGGG